MYEGPRVWSEKGAMGMRQIVAPQRLSHKPCTACGDAFASGGVRRRDAALEPAGMH